MVVGHTSASGKCNQSIFYDTTRCVVRCLTFSVHYFTIKETFKLSIHQWKEIKKKCMLFCVNFNAVIIIYISISHNNFGSCHAHFLTLVLPIIRFGWVWILYFWLIYDSSVTRIIKKVQIVNLNFGWEKKIIRSISIPMINE